MRELNNVVLDTNILVSALWSKDGNPNKIVRMMLSGEITNYYSDDTMEEYKDVLFREKFINKFSYNAVNELTKKIVKLGKKVVVCNSDILLTDEDDRAFYDVAKTVNAILITGNIKHYPDEDFIMTPSEFLTNISKLIAI